MQLVQQLQVSSVGDRILLQVFLRKRRAGCCLSVKDEETFDRCRIVTRRFFKRLSGGVTVADGWGVGFLLLVCQTFHQPTVSVQPPHCFCDEQGQDPIMW